MFTTLLATTLTAAALATGATAPASPSAPTHTATAAAVAGSTEIRVQPMKVSVLDNDTYKITMALPGSCYTGRAAVIRDHQNTSWIRAYVAKTGTKDCTSTPFATTQTVKVQEGDAPSANEPTVLDLDPSDPVAIDINRAADWAKNA